ncbi:MAG: hypothetical protein ACPHY8_03175 [Patescibacteria group bacterium]
MIDRVDIFIEVPKVKTQKLQVNDNYDTVEDSKTIQKRVQAARDIQLKRFQKLNITSNSEMSTKEINVFCKLDDSSDALLKQAVTTMNLSARAYYRILKLARTIADLQNNENISMENIAEALSFRKKQEN